MIRLNLTISFTFRMSVPAPSNRMMVVNLLTKFLINRTIRTLEISNWWFCSQPKLVRIISEYCSEKDTPVYAKWEISPEFSRKVYYFQTVRKGIILHYFHKLWLSTCLGNALSKFQTSVLKGTRINAILQKWTPRPTLPLGVVFLFVKPCEYIEYKKA